jgi:hypothetical protein
MPPAACPGYWRSRSVLGRCSDAVVQVPPLSVRMVAQIGAGAVA